MIRYLWVGAVLLLSSCGIISIESLPPPPVPDPTVTQNDFRKLTFTHNSGTYSSNADFQGYEVYYKLYAPATGPFDNLTADNSQLLSVTPTRDYLINLGYQRMSASDQNSGNVPLIADPGNGDVIVLDFTDFFDKMNVPNPPTSHTQSPIAARPTIQVGGGSPFFVFRTISTSGVFSYPWFSDLYKPWTTATSDMARLGTYAILPSTDEYEIDVFLVAYSFTPEQTIYSQPVPWGVISPLEVDK